MWVEPSLTVASVPLWLSWRRAVRLTASKDKEEGSAPVGSYGQSISGLYNPEPGRWGHPFRVPVHFKTCNALKQQAAAHEPIWPAGGKDISLKLQNRHEICTWGGPLTSADQWWVSIAQGWEENLLPVVCSAQQDEWNFTQTERRTTNRTVFTVSVLGSTLGHVGGCPVVPVGNVIINSANVTISHVLITESWSRTYRVAVHYGNMYLLDLGTAAYQRQRSQECPWDRQMTSNKTATKTGNYYK